MEFRVIVIFLHCMWMNDAVIKSWYHNFCKKSSKSVIGSSKTASYFSMISSLNLIMMKSLNNGMRGGGKNIIAASEKEIFGLETLINDSDKSKNGNKYRQLHILILLR